MMTPLPRQLDQLQQPLLERVWAQLNRAQNDLWTTVNPPCTRPLAVKLIRVVGHKVTCRPVALEHRTKLREHVRISRGGYPNIPLETGYLRRVRQVR